MNEPKKLQDVIEETHEDDFDDIELDDDFDDYIEIERFSD